MVGVNTPGGNKTTQWEMLGKKVLEYLFYNILSYFFEFSFFVHVHNRINYNSTFTYQINKYFGSIFLNNFLQIGVSLYSILFMFYDSLETRNSSY